MFQQIKQLLQTPNSLQMLKNLTRNNPQLSGLLNQLEALTPEQQQKKLDEVMGQMGISKEQLQMFLGYK